METASAIYPVLTGAFNDLTIKSTIKNIVVTGARHEEVFDEITEDLKSGCPEVTLRTHSLDYPDPGYNPSELRVKKYGARVYSFSRGKNTINVISIRSVAGLDDLWEDLNIKFPAWVLLHTTNKENEALVIVNDRPHILWSNIMQNQPCAIMFLITGGTMVSKNVSTYLDTAVPQDFKLYPGYVVKIIYSEQSSFRRGHSELIARRINARNANVVLASGVYELIDKFLALNELTCLELSDKSRPRVEMNLRPTRPDISRYAPKPFDSQPWKPSLKQISDTNALAGPSNNYPKERAITSKMDDRNIVTISTTSQSSADSVFMSDLTEADLSDGPSY